MPQGIQLRRTKGWRLPANTVVVSRPGRWGNPFKVCGENEYLYCDASHVRKILTPWVIFDQHQEMRQPTAAEVVDYFRRWIAREFNEAGIVRPCEFTSADFETLKGKDLACWCSVDKPCHRDVLLEVANHPGGYFGWLVKNRRDV